VLSPQINGNAIFGDRWASLESTVRPIFLGAVAMSAFFLSHRYHTQKTITCFEEPFNGPADCELESQRCFSRVTAFVEARTPQMSVREK